MFRDPWPAATAVLVFAATLTLGCARPIALAHSGSPDSELAALVDSVAARRLLADLYKSYPENGADFANQRRLLASLGIGNGLIESARATRSRTTRR